MILDDDLRFCVRKSTDDIKLRQCEPEDIDALFQRIEQLLDEYPMVGVSSREGNNHKIDPLDFAARQMQVHAIRTDFFRKADIRPSTVVFKSDFFMTLSVLTRGQPNAIVSHWCVDQALGSNAPGGVSLYRTVEKMNEGAERLRQLFPDFVKIVEKPIVWKGMKGKFNDVRMQWKKAYEHGKRSNRLDL